jgi:hypothetical protein
MCHQLAWILSAQTIQAHSAQFYSKFNSNLTNKDHTAYPMPDEMLMKITVFLLHIKDGSTVGQLKKKHPRGYSYISMFDVINLVAGDKPILVYRQKPDESGTLPPVNQCVCVLCRSTFFVDFRAVHIASGTHMKGNKLLNAVKSNFWASIPSGHVKCLPQLVHCAFRGASGLLIRQDINPSSCLVLAVMGNLTLLICNLCQMGCSNGS